MSDIDTRICNLLTQMLAKKPAGQVITSAVAIKIFEGKFKEAFGGIDFSTKTALIEKFLADNQKDVAAAAPAKPAAKAAAASGSDSDSDDSDASEEMEEEEDEEDESVFDDSEDDEEEEEPAAKKLRTELLTGDVGARVEAMLNCARKSGYRPKNIVSEGDAAQTPEAYLNTYLIPFYESKGMDPTKFGEADVKKYRKAKEVEELAKDGANLNLDRSSRRGRGILAPVAPAAPKPSFMDDE